MPNRVQTFRSATPGSRPTPGTRLPGELYVNWPDAQFGVINAGQAPQDLIAVRFFSALASYAIGDHVINAGVLYRAKVAVSPAAFSAAQWDLIITSAGGTLTGVLTLAADPIAALQATTKQYVDLHAGAVVVASAPPVTPNPGQLWWDNVGAQLYISYNDGDSTQWVSANNLAANIALDGVSIVGDGMVSPLAVGVVDPGSF